jgi:Protein of unknown function (DUF998)
MAAESAPVLTTFSRTSQTAARLSMAAAALFVLLLAALHVLKPEVDPAWRMISDYELGRYGFVMVLAFGSLAVSSASLFVAIRPHAHSVAGWIGLCCLLACSVALLGGGIFTTDPITAPSDQLTTHGALHGLSALVGVASMPFAASLISWSLRLNLTWARARGRLFGAVGLVWLSVVVFGVSLAVLLPRGGGKFGPEVVIGWQNRLIMVTYCVWLVVVGWRMARLRASDQVLRIRRRREELSPGHTLE